MILDVGSRLYNMRGYFAVSMAEIEVAARKVLEQPTGDVTQDVDLEPDDDDEELVGLEVFNTKAYPEGFIYDHFTSREDIAGAWLARALERSFARVAEDLDRYASEGGRGRGGPADVVNVAVEKLYDFFIQECRLRRELVVRVVMSAPLGLLGDTDLVVKPREAIRRQLKKLVSHPAIEDAISIPMPSDTLEPDAAQKYDQLCDAYLALMMLGLAVWSTDRSPSFRSSTMIGKQVARLISPLVVANPNHGGKSGIEALWPLYREIRAHYYDRQLLELFPDKMMPRPLRYVLERLYRQPEGVERRT